jgi:hypothetical protein
MSYWDVKEYPMAVKEYSFQTIGKDMLADIRTICLMYGAEEQFTEELVQCVVDHYNKLGEIL